MLNPEDVKKIALDNGFKLKEQPDGSLDLNPYVYQFADALAAFVLQSHSNQNSSAEGD